MKKAIILIAAILVAFIPTYILIFQLAKTAPEIAMGEEELEPAFVRWCVVNRDGEEVITSRSMQKAQKQFAKAEPVSLGSPDPIQSLTFSREPASCLILFYDLSGNGYKYDPMTYADFCEKGITLTDKAQAVMTVEWRISDSIRVQAAYSFEVNA